MPDLMPYYMDRVPKLRQRGDEWRAPCPIHNGERESFSVDPETGKWRCFSDCDEGGDAIRLEERLTGRKFVEAKKVVEEFLGMSLDAVVGGSSSPRPRATSPSAPKKPEDKGPATFGRLVKTYDYLDAEGTLVYQVCRYEPKAFSQRRPDPDKPGRFLKGLGGLERMLYRLPEVLRSSGPVWLPEGERDVDMLRDDWQLNATCNSGGAGKFTASMAKQLAGRLCYVLVDNDPPHPKNGKFEGEVHADKVATLLAVEGCQVKLIRFGRNGEGPKDATDWREAGGTLEQLERMAEEAPLWEPAKVAKAHDDVIAPDTIPANVWEMLNNYVILVGSDMIWDHRRGRTVGQKELKLAHAADFNAWVKDPSAQRVDLERLVFKPQGCQPDEINTFRGLRMKPDASKRCERLVEHVAFLCGGDPGLTHWLTSWLAYPLQNLGAKMRTAVVVHGGQGTGKSILFETVASIYGEYSAIIGQTQIDSPYTGWASRKLFVLADEVLSKQEARTIKNRLKSMITGDELIIEEKYRQARTEQNSMNLVFLSNEETPVIVERDDRRFTVIRVDRCQEPGYYEALASEIRNGGAEGFMAYLMAYDLKGFDSHAKPYDTVAKSELVEVSLSPSDRFLDVWEAGELPVPFGPAASLDLFEAMRLWALESGERFGLPTSTAFGRVAGRRYDKVQQRLGDGRRALVYFPMGQDADPVKSDFELLEGFVTRLEGWRDRLQKARIL